ncbi:MAG TPA: SgcJ/EcaC family oxidoreductase [Candidatus Acidoferrales bacterium]|nr:SgcJ/EcaC family oxidoreductase [Candidatus Acidoferrales bacterium]
MRLKSFIAALALSLIFPAIAARAQGQASGSDADSAAIKKVCADFSKSFSRHDAHAVAMTFADDADFTNMNGRHSHGRADIEKWFAGLFHGNLKDSLRTDTVKSIRYFSPDLAAVDADTVITGTKTADGSEIPPRKGLMVVLAVKENGQWYIGTFHESEYPAPRGEAAK